MWCRRTKRLLGHTDISTTTRYLHLKQSEMAATDSPLDLLQQTGMPLR
jgi:site-specific recombinase XerD